ncbi:urease accessory protein UreE 1 [Variibacter gotjawalensis]|uniref:Urease accessory protein UreE n=1 Tax=Variibacter gotjawalensis TaxID=1333996 RepID=A0A0S3PSF8_9BRAD|nr:urease accessory protein UreE [Variibacter gotjawalensis]NIK49146.1 urease accessory protein [Variibacter gotjawalensis]RZS51002.1 urease accessory protein [Variibacter gotjawalensis]BAT58836.1 urease accessory protein UreE 1 [Variibacter gotjawalensis]
MSRPRAFAVKPAGKLAQEPFDFVELPHDGRYRRRITMRTEGDLVFLLDLEEAVHLRHGDGLVLDDGRIIGVVAADEPVAEITASDAHHLTRLAWHIGNRHVPAQILADRIRIAPDPIIEEMARGLGGTVESLLAQFDPEGGAYEAAEAHGHAHAHSAHSHSHSHAHAHSHSHSHDHGQDRSHVHGPGCGHDHVHDENCGHGHAHDHAHDHAHHHGHAHKS